MTAEERLIELSHPEKECENPACKKKFRAKRGRDRYCCPECRKKDNARMQREKRKKEKKEAAEFMRRETRETDALSFEEMAKLQQKHNLSYGKIEDAIRCGRIKVEEC